MAGRTGIIRTGTSGWSYSHWRERFYPKGLAQSKWLDYYQGQFPTVEVNATFYRLPSAATVGRWRASALPGFEYVVKGSRYVTHARRPGERGVAVRNVIERLDRLGEAFTVVLWQFPGRFEREPAALDGFLATLPRGVRHVVEFRHESWFEHDTVARLRDAGVALVAASARDLPAVRETTADFVYCRFHGLAGGYAHDYRERELQPWADWALEAAAAGTDGYFFFNNDGEARAPANARRFIEMTGDAAVDWPPRE